MPHECVDWTTNPPARKIPLLVLTRGDDHVYTSVPKEFKALENIARREFDLGDAEIVLSSSCLNLCSGQPARITESAWEHISPYIGCITAEVPGARAVPPQSLAFGNAENEHGHDAKQTLLSSASARDEGEQVDTDGGKPSNSTREPAQDKRSAPPDHGNDLGGAEDQPEEPSEEEARAVSPRKPRSWHCVMSEDENEGESEREHEAPPRPQVLPVASPAEPTQPAGKVEKEGAGDHRFQSDSQSDELLHQPSKPIKQEKRGTRSGNRAFSYDDSQPPHTESQYENQPQARAEPGESQKLMIRVAHRPSKQESKFTTKSTTKVAKVLAGACKSFGLDAARATLYLIISMEDEDDEVENLFPCDRSDTIARAGAEYDTESRFLLKIGGEA